LGNAADRVDRKFAARSDERRPQARLPIIPRHAIRRVQFRRLTAIDIRVSDGTINSRGETMSEHVYKLIELAGSSSVSSDDAVRNALAKAHQSVRNIHWFTVTETRGHVIDGKVAHWQVSLKVGFTLD
jgi:flavin-binding protein dodecin